MGDIALRVSKDAEALFAEARRFADQLHLTLEAVVCTALVRHLGWLEVVQVPVYPPGGPLAYHAFRGRWLGLAPGFPAELWELAGQHLLGESSGTVVPLAARHPEIGVEHSGWRVNLAATAGGRIAAYR